MNVARPALLYALFALPLFALGFFIQYRRLFPLLRNMSLQKDPFLKTRYGYSGVFGLFTLAALVIAAAGPSLTVKYQEERKGGMDIVFAFDVSRSMNVRDITHNGETITRLEGAKIIASGLITAMGSRQTEYRYAAAVGKGEGVLAVPLTYGSETVQTMIDSLSSQTISAAGTDVEKLIRAALGAFPPDLSASHPAEKAVIVFTDGETLSGWFQDAVEKAKEARITVNAVCVGSEKGGPVPIGLSEQGATLFLLDKNGKTIVSRAEPDALKEAVEQSNGLFFPVTGDTDTIEAALAIFYEAFLSRENGEGEWAGEEENEEGEKTVIRETEKQQDAVFIFAALALVFFALHKGAFYTLAPKPVPKSGPRKKRALLSVASLFFLFLSCAPIAPITPFAPIAPMFASIEAKFRLLEGNFYVTRNMLAEAEASYTRSRSLAAPGDIPYTLYALGLVRLLSEKDEAAASVAPEEEADGAAIAFFDQAHALIMTDAAGTGADEDMAAYVYWHQHAERHRQLVYRIHYNSGIAHYRAGNAEEAAREFRRALLVDPGRIEAKRNLEISLILLENKNTVETSEIKSARPVREGVSRENTVLFDFIRQKETGRWKSWAWQGGEGDSSKDY
jgi:Ca-activated chloride channel family protein